MVKIRLGHVTNSSSSSFIIARKSKCTREEVINLIIEKLYGDIIEGFQDKWMFKYLDDDIKVAVIQKDYDKAVKLVSEDLYDMLTSYSEMELGDWKVHETEFSNENGFYDYLIYAHGYKLVSDNFKVW